MANQRTLDLSFQGNDFRSSALFADFNWDILPPSLPLAEIDTRRFAAIVHNWHQRLCLLRCGQRSHYYPTEAQIAAFAVYLIQSQRNDPMLPFGNGSWAIPTDTSMPSGAAVDFVYLPTYIALAWLVLVHERYPAIAHKVKGLEKALYHGFEFASTQKLRGHGYDASREMLEAIHTLALGGAFSYVSTPTEK